MLTDDELRAALLDADIEAVTAIWRLKDAHLTRLREDAERTMATLSAPYECPKCDRWNAIIDMIEGDAPMTGAAQEVVAAFTISPGMTTGRQVKAIDALNEALKR